MDETSFIARKESPCVICLQLSPVEQLLFNLSRGAIHILCLTK